MNRIFLIVHHWLLWTCSLVIFNISVPVSYSFELS